MNRLVKYIPLLFFAALFAGCDENKTHVLPRHSGAPGELLCVLSDERYESRTGDIIHEHFGATQPLLPQAEPYFDIVQLTPVQVNNITRYHRNLLFVHISSTHDEKTRVVAERNKWASEQLVVSIYAKSTDEFDSLMTDNGMSILQKFNEYERKRLQSNFRTRKAGGISENLSDHGIDLTLPQGSDIIKDTTNFVWIQRQRERNVSGTMHDILQGIVVYHYPYTTDTAFSQASILSMRDSLLKEHIPGRSPGSFMTTEYLLPPESEAIEFNGQYAVLTRGLWRVDGAVMGGPFVQLTLLDEPRQRVVSVEGFVFAPKFNKREYLREVEAMVYSLELLPKAVQ